MEMLVVWGFRGRVCMPGGSQVVTSESCNTSWWLARKSRGGKQEDRASLGGLDVELSNNTSSIAVEQGSFY